MNRHTPTAMTTAATFLLACLGGLLSCSTTGATTPTPTRVGQPFTLQPGGSARFTMPPLTVGMDAVTSDSRCPKGEQCVWAGDATVRVWWQRAGGSREFGTLHTTPGAGGAVRIDELELRLLDLAPVPISGKAIDPASYRATLELAPATAVSMDR